MAIFIRTFLLQKSVYIYEYQFFARTKKTGHFLHLNLKENMAPRTLQSPPFGPTKDSCKLEIYTNQYGMSMGNVRVVIEPIETEGHLISSWVPADTRGNDRMTWEPSVFPVGKISTPFQILLEIVPPRGSFYTTQRGYFSLDHLALKNCFRDDLHSGTCSASDVRCQNDGKSICLKSNSICDINNDCDDKSDELLNCGMCSMKLFFYHVMDTKFWNFFSADKIPLGGRCDFEKDWCGWQNSGKAILKWQRHSGPTPTDNTGPDTDHTNENHNITGHYMFVNMNQTQNKKLTGFASNAVMNSVIFNPPPPAHVNSSSLYRNSCMVSFNLTLDASNMNTLRLPSCRCGSTFINLVKMRVA